MKTNILFHLVVMLIGFVGISAHAEPYLKCSDDRGNALELFTSKHIQGTLTLVDESTGAVRQHKIDIGGEYGRGHYFILAASPALNGEFYFDDVVGWQNSSIKSVSFHSGHRGWSEQVAISLRCSQ